MPDALEPPEGWYPFGYHIDIQVSLEFSTEVDDAGMPLWERPMEPVSVEERLGLPYRVNKTPQVQGRETEVRMARDRGARVHPNSGSGRIKDDASTEEVQYEFKEAQRSHTLHGAALLALFRRAVRMGKQAEYVIYFKQQNLTATITLQRGHHARGD